MRASCGYQHKMRDKANPPQIALELARTIQRPKTKPNSYQFRVERFRGSNMTAPCPHNAAIVHAPGFKSFRINRFVCVAQITRNTYTHTQRERHAHVLFGVCVCVVYRSYPFKQSCAKGATHMHTKRACILKARSACYPRTTQTTNTRQIFWGRCAFNTHTNAHSAAIICDV